MAFVATKLPTVLFLPVNLGIVSIVKNSVHNSIKIVTGVSTQSGVITVPPMERATTAIVMNGGIRPVGVPGRPIT